MCGIDYYDGDLGWFGGVWVQSSTGVHEFPEWSDQVRAAVVETGFPLQSRMSKCWKVLHKILPKN